MGLASAFVGGSVIAAGVLPFQAGGTAGRRWRRDGSLLVVPIFGDIERRADRRRLLVSASEINFCGTKGQVIKYLNVHVCNTHFIYPQVRSGRGCMRRNLL